MDYINRKVRLDLSLRPYDSGGDGKIDSLTVSAITKNIQVPLRLTFDDMGIFETVPLEERLDIIDISSIWDDTIKGSDTAQPPPTFTGVTSDWGSGDSNGGGTQTNSLIVDYCSDITAENYQGLSFVNGDAILSSSGGTSPNLINQSSSYSAPLPTFNQCCCVYTDNGQQSGGDVGDIGGMSVSFIQNKVSTTSNDECDWIVASSLAAAWALYQPTAIADANAHCIQMGHPGVNYDFGSLYPSTSGACDTWSVFGPRIIGVVLNTAGSEEGYCCYDNTTVESGQATNYTKEGNIWGPAIDTHQTGFNNGNPYNPLPQYVTYETTAPYRYTESGTGGSSDTPTTLCNGMTTENFFDCLHDWSNPNINVGATIHGDLVPENYCSSTQNFPNYFCHGKQKIVSITDSNYGLGAQLPDYNTMAQNGPYGTNFPCVHAAKTYKLSYCFQCAKT